MSTEVADLLARLGPEAIIDAMTPLMTEERRQRIEDVLDQRLTSLTVVVENLYDPHNGAACIRSMESMGLQHLHVVEEAQPFRAESAITIGCDKWITTHKYPKFPECKAALAAEGYRVYATVPGATETIDSLDMSQKVAIVFGNEHDGIRPESVAMCDGAVSIPMFGFTQSLNLSVSVAVTIRELAARRRAHLGQPGDLGDAERAHLRAWWYAVGVRGAAGIIRRAVSE